MSDAALLDAKNAKQLDKALSGGANIHAVDDEGNTKLHLLCKSKSGAMSKTEAEMALVLIERGADVSKPNDDGETPLHLAAASGNHDVIEKLIAKGAKASALTKLGYTPLHYCVSTNDKDTWIWDTLLANGNPLEHVNKWGDTPLLAAQSSHNANAVKYLLAKGANRDAKDSDGKSMVERANEWKQEKILKLL